MQTPERITTLLDLAASFTGSGVWQQALPDRDLAILHGLAKSSVASGVVNRLRGLLTHESTSLEPFWVQDGAIETIGFDAARSVRVTETGDLRSTWYPRRAVHTADGFSRWADEDGLLVLMNGENPMLPDGSYSADIPGTWETWYAVPINQVGDVLALRCPDGTQLLAGSDFYRSEDRLLFREHPLTTSTDGSFLLVLRRPTNSLIAYSCGRDCTEATANHLAQALRHTPTAARLQAAARATAGLLTVSTQDVIVKTAELPVGVRYTGNLQDYLVPYDHKTLPVGTILPAGYCFGDGIKIQDRGQDGPDWWRSLDWSSGLSLDSCCPIKGITMPANPIRALSYSDGGTIRVKLYPHGTPQAVARYQAWCASIERRLPVGKHLAGVLGITTAGVEQQVDGLNLLFTHTWGRRVMVADLRESIRPNVVRMLRDLAPVTATLIIRRLPDLI